MYIYIYIYSIYNVCIYNVYIYIYHVLTKLVDETMFHYDISEPYSL